MEEIVYLSPCPHQRTRVTFVEAIRNHLPRPSAPAGVLDGLRRQGDRAGGEVETAKVNEPRHTSVVDGQTPLSPPSTETRPRSGSSMDRGGRGGEYAQGTTDRSEECGGSVDRGAPTRVVRCYESAPHRVRGPAPMDVDRDRALYRRPGSVGSSEGAVMTLGPTIMNVDRYTANTRRPGSIGISRCAVTTARSTGGGQGGSTTEPYGR